MKDSRRTGIIAGSAGAIFGSLIWIIILGITLKSIYIAVIPMILGLLAFLVVVFIANKKPDKFLRITGVLLVYISGINLVFLNFLFNRIPDTIGGVSTGKSLFTLLQLNFFVGIFLIAGIIILIKDFRASKKLPEQRP